MPYYAAKPKPDNLAFAATGRSSALKLDSARSRRGFSPLPHRTAALTTAQRRVTCPAAQAYRSKVTAVGREPANAGRLLYCPCQSKRIATPVAQRHGGFCGSVQPNGQLRATGQTRPHSSTQAACPFITRHCTALLGTGLLVWVFIGHPSPKVPPKV
jgi:hypothetical protein